MQGARTHIAALDGIRGIAIILVLLTHYHDVFRHGGSVEQTVGRIFDTGWIGVDLFFVLSGFLITGILLDSKGGPLYFQRFYWRRAVRIFPVYFLYVAFVLIGLRVLYLHITGHDLWKGLNAWWYLSYFSNWKSDHGNNDLYLSHFWSLAVEEQFYFVWPAVVCLCTRRRLAATCAGLAAAAFLVRCLLVTHGAAGQTLYRLTPCRMDPLVLGALVALVIRNEVCRARLQKCLLPVAAAMMILIGWIAAAKGSFDFNNPLSETVGASALAVLFACVVFFAVAGRGGAARSFLQTSWLRAAGRYSYSVYVVHVTPHFLLLKPVEHLILRQSRLLQPVLRCSYLGAMLAMAFGAGWVSWRVLEQPLAKLKDRLPVVGHKPAFAELQDRTA